MTQQNIPCEICNTYNPKSQLINCRFCPINYFYCKNCIERKEYRSMPFCDEHLEAVRISRPHFFKDE